MKLFFKNKAAVVSMLFLVVLSITAICAPWVTKYSYETQNIEERLITSSKDHPLGTDSLGRDQWSRIIYGARVSLAVGLITTIWGLILGLIIGAASGYFGGKIDQILMRVVDAFYIFPSILMAILVMVILGQGLSAIIVALSLVSWVSIARLVRGQVMQLKSIQYVEAARSLGVSDLRILARHILPNLVGPILVAATYQIPSNIMAESFLSFLGLGIQPPYSSWGTLANEGWRAMQSYPHLILAPGVFLFGCMIAFQFFGDGLRDGLDPFAKKGL